MPNIKSAKKRVKVSKTKTAQNRVVRSSLRTTIKKASLTIENGDKALASSQYLQAIKSIDKAASKGIIHKNTAARRKSSLTLKMNVLAN